MANLSKGAVSLSGLRDCYTWFEKTSMCNCIQNCFSPTTGDDNDDVREETIFNNRCLAKAGMSKSWVLKQNSHQRSSNSLTFLRQTKSQVDFMSVSPDYIGRMLRTASINFLREAFLKERPVSKLNANEIAKQKKNLDKLLSQTTKPARILFISSVRLRKRTIHPLVQ